MRAREMAKSDQKPAPALTASATVFVGVFAGVPEGEWRDSATALGRVGRVIDVGAPIGSGNLR